MLQMLTELIAGLGLFLFGMKFMGESLQKAAGDQMRDLLSKVAGNRFSGVLFGTLFTAIIQSSGACTVMEVNLVNAGLMTVRQSVGITFGASIGTTITSQLVSLKLTAVAPFIVFLGAVLIMFGKKPMTRKIAEIIFGFGALFLGISSMSDALAAIPEHPEIMQLFTYMSNPVIALIVGLVFTLITQSSSVTVSVLVLLAGSGLVNLLSCCFFILGANVGACTPTMMAGMGCNKEAKRAAVIFLLRESFGALLILVLLIFFRDPIINWIASIDGAENYNRFVANANTVFKVVPTFLFLPFVDQFVALAEKIYPDGPEEADQTMEEKLLYIGSDNGMFAYSTAVVEVVQELHRMANLAGDNLREAMEALFEYDEEKLKRIDARETVIDYLSSAITDYLVSINRHELPLADATRIGGLFHVVIDLERIGDHAVNFAENAHKKHAQHEDFSDRGKEELQTMFETVQELYDMCIHAFTEYDKTKIDQIITLENQVDDMETTLKDHQVRSLSKGESSVGIGLIFTDMVIGLERVGDHSTNIAYSILREDPEDDENLSSIFQVS